MVSIAGIMSDNISTSQVAQVWPQSARDAPDREPTPPEGKSFVADKSSIDGYRSKTDAEIGDHRKQAKGEIVRMLSKSRKRSRQIWNGHKSAAVSGHLGVDLLDRLVAKFGHSDTNPAKDIVDGFDLVGMTPDVGVFSDRDPLDFDLPSLEDIWPGVRRKSKPTSMSDRLIRHCWQTVRDESAQGWSNEISEQEAVDGDTSVNFMFSIDQSSPEPTKHRAAVHYKYVNSAARIREKIELPSHRRSISQMIYAQNGRDVSQSLETKTAIISEMNFAKNEDAKRVEKTYESSRREFESSPPASLEEASDRSFGESLFDDSDSAAKRVKGSPPPKTFPSGFFGRDFESAYKQMSCKNRSHNVIGCFDPDSNKHRLYTCSHMRFGSVWAASSWIRISKCIKALLRSIFWIVEDIYIDDLVGIERLALIDETADLVDWFMGALGFRMSADESESGRNLRILGLDYAVEDHAVAVNLRHSKREAIARDISSAVGAISHQGIAARRISAITGKTNFLPIATRCSGLASALSPLYAAIAGLEGDMLVPEDLARPLIPSLNHLKHLVMTTPPLKVRAVDWRPNITHIWTDASSSEFEHRAAFVMIHKQKIYISAFEYPGEMIRMLQARKQKPIGLLELGALILALGSVLPILQSDGVDSSGKVLFHCDNTTAVFGVLKGTSRDIFCRILVQHFRSLAASRSILFSIRYVPTKSNIPDGGTRSDLLTDFCEALKSLNMPCRLMPVVQEKSLLEAMGEITRKTSAMSTP